MTEQEWLECADPAPMLDFLQGKGSDRKLRLFAVGCCRQIWHLLRRKRSRMAVEMAERFADGHLARNELTAAINASRKVVEAAFSAACDAACEVGYDNAKEAAFFTSWSAVDAVAWNKNDSARLVPRKEQTVILRDIFGNPFRPLSFNPTWRTSTVQQLAEAIYQEKAFDRLPILADALEDAGCDSAELVNHLRQPSEHVRGCWALDAVLGKE